MLYGYINGVVRPVADIALGVSDLGLLRGHGLFDYMRTYRGQLFHWDWYWQRLTHSAHRMQLTLPFDQNHMYDIVMDLVARSNEQDIAIRTVVTGGYSMDSMTPTVPNVVIMVEMLPAVPAKHHEHGIHVLLDDYVREMADVKTTDYKHVILKAAEMQSRDATDILYYHDGVISELSRSNVFIVKDNVIMTPDRDILRGITRRVVMDMVKEHYAVRETTVTVEDVRQADEVFTTSTVKLALPITRVDGRPIGNGVVGPVTRHVEALLKAHIHELCA